MVVKSLFSRFSNVCCTLTWESLVHAPQQRALIRHGIVEVDAQRVTALTASHSMTSATDTPSKEGGQAVGRVIVRLLYSIDNACSVADDMTDARTGLEHGY